jgi:hypothetical protein
MVAGHGAEKVAPAVAPASCRHGTRSPRPSDNGATQQKTAEGNPVSKSQVLTNFIQALAAVVLGNLAYFLLARSLPLPRHRPFQMDIGLIIDFWFCLVAYGLIRTARKWK